MQNSDANLIHVLFECIGEHIVKISENVMETDSDALRSITDKSTVQRINQEDKSTALKGCTRWTCFLSNVHFRIFFMFDYFTFSVSHLNFRRSQNANSKWKRLVILLKYLIQVSVLYLKLCILL